MHIRPDTNIKPKQSTDMKEKKNENQTEAPASVHATEQPAATPEQPANTRARTAGATAPAEESAPEAPAISALIAEAEQRGYLRGRNESIEALMQRPGMMEHRDTGRPQDPSDTEPMILGNRRPSIWEMG